MSVCTRCCYLAQSTLAHSAELEALKGLRDSVLDLARALDPPVTPQFTEELALDLTELLRAQGALEAPEAEHLRVLLLGMNEKLKVTELLQQQLAELKHKLQLSLRSREELWNTTQDTLKELEREKAHLQELNLRTTQERNKAEIELNCAVRAQRNSSAETEELTAKHQFLLAEHQALKAQARDFDGLQGIVSALQGQVRRSDDARTALRTEYNKALEEFQNATGALGLEVANLSQEKAALEEQVSVAEGAITALEHTARAQDSAVLQSSATIQALTAELYATSDQAEKAVSMEQLALSHQEQCARLTTALQDSTERHLQELQQLDIEKLHLLHKLKEYSEEVRKLNVQTQTLNETVESLNAENCKLSGTLAATEEKLCVQEDSLNLLDVLDSLKQNKELFLQDYYNEMHEMTDFLLVQSQQSIYHQQLACELAHGLSEKRHELHLLRAMVTQLQNSTAYHAVRGDPVDEAFAEYLSNRESSLNVPFVREDQGVYLFGSKRVFMKLENGKLIIRVGGGYMHIDEFIEMYMPLEIDRERAKKHTEGPKGPKAHKAHKNFKGLVGPEVSPQQAAKLVKQALGGTSSGFTTLLAVPRKASPLKPAVTSRKKAKK